MAGANGGDVEAEVAGRMQAAEAAEEGGRACVAEPALAGDVGADEGSGEADAEEDLYEEIVVVEHGRDGRCGRRRRLRRPEPYHVLVI